MTSKAEAQRIRSKLRLLARTAERHADESFRSGRSWEERDWITVSLLLGQLADSDKLGVQLALGDLVLETGAD